MDEICQESSFNKKKIIFSAKLIASAILISIIAHSTYRITEQSKLVCVTCSPLTLKCEEQNCNYDKSKVKDVPEYCFSYENNLNVTRGCLYDDQNEKYKDLCLDPRNPHCMLCNFNGCNDQKMMSSCYECDSRNDTKCLNHIDDLTPRICVVNRERPAGCYRYKNEGVVKLGCFADLPVEMQKKCNDNIGTCKVCLDDDCNEKPNFQQCYVCDSGENSDCSIMPNKVKVKTCRDYYDTCFTKIDKTRTIRGCSAEYHGKNVNCDNNLCSTCKDNKCNDQIFPEQRLQCHQCFGTLGEPCSGHLSMQNASLKPCMSYNKYDFCYEYFDVNVKKVLYRGCLSDNTPEATLCNTGSNSGCKLCTTDGCNSHPPFTNSTLKCVHCDEENEECPWGHEVGEAEDCTEHIPLGYNELCYQKIDENGKVQRGCSTSNVDICNGLSNKHCRLCNEDACNNENFVYQSCIKCNTTTNSQEFCAKKIENDLYSSLCSKFMTYAKRGCYTFRKSLTSENIVTVESEDVWSSMVSYMKFWESAPVSTLDLNNNIITRGCAKDFDQTKENVTAHDYFKLCSGPNCNTEEPPASGSVSHIMLSKIILFTIACTTLFAQYYY